ncbi:MAG: VOC family protein [Pyrinomonadaceae bacterium]
MPIEQKITPCLWFDDQAEDAANFYASTLKNTKVNKITRYGNAGYDRHGREEGTVMTSEFSIDGYDFLGLNGGPAFTKNPSISFFYICDSEEEINGIWNEFSRDGKIMMGLDKYEWSERYGFIEDRFGVSWQFSLGDVSDVGQRVTPCFLFVGEQFGKGEEAVNFYTKVFENSSIDGILLYGENEAPNKPGSVKHAQFSLDGCKFMLMESGMEHDFAFNEGISLSVMCEDQAEVDRFWDTFTEEGKESMCGWLNDKYGVSWQIVPKILPKLMSDPERAGRVMEAFMKMKKYDIKKLEAA